MPAAAFAPSAPVGVMLRVTPQPSSTCGITFGTAHSSSRRRRSAHMCEETLTAAEKTRRALSESEPLVKFRRDPEYLEERAEKLGYTRGEGGGIDIWVITAVLTLLVPAVGFAVGVATGNIDVHPR